MKILRRITVLLLLFPGIIYSQSLSTSLTACYSFDANALDPINGFNGTVGSAVTPTVNRFNVTNSAYFFNGTTSSFIELYDNPLLKPSNELSFAVWLKPNSNTAAHIIYTKNNLSSNFEAYQLCIFSGSPVFRLNKSSSSGNNVALSSTTITPGTWYHVACTFDNSSIKLYLNGVLQGSAACTFSGFDYEIGKKVYIGDTHESFNFPYNGSMDNLRFYNRTLSAAEVGQLYTFDPACITSTTTTPPTVAAFTSPDTVCVNQTFTLQNTSIGPVSSNYWSACSSTALATPQATNSGNILSALNGPVFLSVNKDGGNYYAFITNNTVGSIVRINYGSSLNNSPLSSSVIATGLSNVEDIHIQKEGSNWYGVTVGGLGSSYIARLSFGTSLANTPTITNMGNIGALSYPVSLVIYKENNIYYGLTINYSSSSLTRFNFGSSLANIPSAVNLGNIGTLNGPAQMEAINYNSNWYTFICNDNNSTLTRLDFGTSLSNTPIGVNIGNPNGNLNFPRGLSLSTDCNGLKGLIANRGNNTLMTMDFPTGPTGSITLNSLGNLGSLNFPASITNYRVGDSTTYFIPNASSNSITRIDYPTCTSIPSTTLQNPSMTFTAPGTYTISLNCNEGLIDQSKFCKTIYVAANPTITVVSNPQLLCAGGTATMTATGANTYTWQPGNLAGNVVNVNPLSSTVYTIFGNTSNGCSSTSYLTLNLSPTFSINASANPNSVCPGNSTTLSASGASTYTWNPGNLIGQLVVVNPLSPTVYTVTGTNGGCEATKTTSVNIGLMLTLTSSGNLCNNSTVDLMVTPTSTATSIAWTGPGIIGSANTATISINAGGVYSVTVTDTVTSCSGSGTINVFSTNNPFFLDIISSSTVTCFPGPPINMLVSAPVNLSWQPSNLVNPSTGPLVSTNPSVTTTYTVIGTLGSCSASAAITISVNATPTVQLSQTNYSVCSLNSVSVSASGASDYLWIPSNQSGDTVSFFPYASTSTAYVYTVTGFNGNCSHTQTFVMHVEPSSSLTVFASPATICIGNTSTLSVTGANSYTWQSAISNTVGSNFIVTPTVTSHYTVTGTNSLGCNSTASVQINVINSPAISASSSSSVICAGESVTLSASGASSYTWLPMYYVGSSIVTRPNVSTTYTVSSDNSNCNYATLIVIVNKCVNTSLGITNAASKPEPSGSNYYKIRFTITVGNDSNSDLSNLELKQDLIHTFPFPSTFTLQSKPRITSLNSQIILNTNYNGVSDLNLTLASASSLKANKRDTLLVDVLLEPKGFTGQTKNSVIGTALDINNIVVIDSSNNGFLWDPDLDGNPTNNNIETPIVIEPLVLFIPEGFSPNGDGNHDRFVIGGLNGKSVSITIFNRWGNKVYLNGNYDNSWDGTANTSSLNIGNGKLPEGTYYYIIEFSEGGHDPINGFVVLRY